MELQPEVYSREISSAGSVCKPIDVEHTIPVTLKFDPNMAFRVYDEFTDAVTEDAQGNLWVHTNLPNSDFLYSYLFSFADGVEVVEPEQVRERMNDTLTAMQQKYRTEPPAVDHTLRRHL